MKLLSIVVLAATTSCAALSGCAGGDGSDGEGTASFTTWGESFIEEGIPAAEFEDGWSVKYDKFLVVFQNLKVANRDGTLGAEMRTAKLFDMAKPGVKPVVKFPRLAARPWDHVSYEIAPASADTELGAATDADKALMAAGGFSVYVSATATKGATTKRLQWGFKTRTTYDRCEGELAGKTTAGLVITNGGTDEAQLTIHGDHLYYDDLQSKDAKLRFDTLADADADGDGTITLDELAKVKLATLPKDYGIGSASGIHDLGAYVAGLSRTIGHFRGEGECFASAK